MKILWQKGRRSKSSGNQTILSKLQLGTKLTLPHQNHPQFFFLNQNINTISNLPKYNPESENCNSNIRNNHVYYECRDMRSEWIIVAYTEEKAFQKRAICILCVMRRHEIVHDGCGKRSFAFFFFFSFYTALL